jgi:serine/threonine protein kinase
LTKFNSQQNMHIVQPDIKVHTVVTGDMDFDHESAMKIPLGEVNDEQLMAEVARRKLDLHDKITDSLVKEAYDLGRILGRGASGEVLFCTHRVTKQAYACKLVRRNSGMNDAQSMSTEIEIMKRIRHRHVVSMYELYVPPSLPPSLPPSCYYY